MSLRLALKRSAEDAAARAPAPDPVPSSKPATKRRKRKRKQAKHPKSTVATVHCTHPKSTVATHASAVPSVVSAVPLAVPLDAMSLAVSSRRSSRNPSAALEGLAQTLLTGGRVVFVTGAGLSVASGIRPFRGEDDAVWAQSVQDWGTRRRFLKDPIAWYNVFFRRHFNSSVTYFPNPGHAAIAKVCAAFPATACVITQNIDSLHSCAEGKVAEAQLIEVHGRADVYKCFSEGCLFAQELSCAAENVVYKRSDASLAAAPRKKNAVHSDLTAETLPHCPRCGAALCPNCLLFDEEYSSHSLYQFDKARAWLRDADALVFVGTSFAVRITDMAFEAATDHPEARGAAECYNFNIVNEVPEGKARGVNVAHVRGKCEETLPRLAAMVCR